MKKLSLSLIFSILFVLTLAISIFALDVNVAGEATSTSKYPEGAWNVDPRYLIDGDRGTGTSSTHMAGERYTEMTVHFDEVHTFTKLVFVVNGIGVYPTDPGAFTFTSMTTFDYWFHVWLLDEQGNTVKDLGNYQSSKANENQEIIINLDYVKCSKIKVSIDGQWNNKIGLWELEAYEHISCDYDTLKEIKNPSTCAQEGVGIYECKCGNTAELISPPTGNHIYDDIENVVYENNNYLTYGTKTLGCITCDRTVDDFALPVFRFLGYSLNASGTTICAGYIINEKQIEEYNIGNKITLSYGVISAVSTESTIIDVNGNVLNGIKGKASDVSSIVTPRFDIKISSSNWEGLKDESIILCAYVIDRESISYICHQEATINASPITYNTIKNNLMAQP